MIGRLTGRIVEEAGDGSLTLDVAGVGYELLTPLGAVGRAEADAAGAVTLFVHTHVREDALLLYGFPTREDRAAFRSLIAVSNVGPKIAVAILGVMAAGELAQAIARREAPRLTKIPGVGKKTAERLVLELKDKILAPAPTALAGPPPRARAASGDPGESEALLLHGALTRLGYRPSEADRAVAAVRDRLGSTPLDELIRDALALLAP